MVEINVGILPYEDGSGHRFEVAYRDGQLWLEQGSDIITIGTKEWPVLRAALDRVLAAHAGLAVSRADRGAGS